MSRKRELALITAGILAGAALVPTTHGAAQYLTATPSARAICLEGHRLESYTIQDRDYIPVDRLEGLLQISYQSKRILRRSAGRPACPHLRLVQAPSTGAAEGRGPALHGGQPRVPVPAKPL